MEPTLKFGMSDNDKERDIRSSHSSRQHTSGTKHIVLSTKKYLL